MTDKVDAEALVRINRERKQREQDVENERSKQDQSAQTSGVKHPLKGMTQKFPLG